MKSAETRNDGITVWKSLLCHLLQHSSVSYIDMLKIVKCQSKDFLTLIPSFLVSVLFIDPYFHFNF